MTTAGGRVAKAIDSLLLVESHLTDLERHSSEQVKQLQEEQEVLATSAEYAVPSTLVGAANMVQPILAFHSEMKTLQTDFHKLQQDNDDFVKETYEMFSESSAIICDAIRELRGGRR
ncbi:hypothetical protein HOP50_02g13940 [Chloropicon primus]|nr:hypothetical protein HOP50_02g13940 [Chloropicon primus]